MLKRLETRRPPGRRWFKRSDRIFLGIFLFLILAAIVVSHLSSSSQSQSSQALIPTSSLPASASPSSASQGGQGSMTASQQNTNPSQAPGLNANAATGQAIGLQPQQPQAPNDLGDDWLIGNDNHGLLAWTDPGLTIDLTVDKAKPIQLAWGGVLFMADAFLVLFIMLNGIRVALGGVGFRYADVLESLPRILLAFAAANLSQLFITELLALNNGLCAGIIAIAQNNHVVDTGGITFLTLILSIAAVVAVFVGYVLFNVFGNLALPGIGLIIGNVVIGIPFATSVLNALIELTLLALYFFLAIQLLIRIALINLLTILAPLGFASWALPQGAGQQLMRIWLNATFASIMVQFLQLTCYIFGLLLFNPLVTTINHLPFVGFGNYSADLLCKIAVTWITLRIPGLVQNVATQMMGEGSRNMSSMISQTVGAGLSVISTTAIVMR